MAVSNRKQVYIPFEGMIGMQYTIDQLSKYNAKHSAHVLNMISTIYPNVLSISGSI